MDREAAIAEKTSALAAFTEGYAKYMEQNQSEIDSIEDQKMAFRQGKKELVESMRALI